MSIVKTLGGERLGTGKKMKVAMHGWGRTTFNRGYIWRSTMAPGVVIPFLVDPALPGATYDIELDCDVKTQPTIGPLFGSYKLELDIFKGDIRLYNGLLHNNTLNIGRNISQVKFPQITLKATRNAGGVVVNDMDNCQINPSCVLAYLGLRGVGSTDQITLPERTFNAVPILLYWDIIKNYYTNKQEIKAYVIHTPAAALVQTVAGINLDGASSGTLGQKPAMDVLFVQNGTIIIISYTLPDPPPLMNQIMVLTQNNGLKSLADLGKDFVDDGAGNIVGNYNFAKWGTDYWYNWDYRAATDLSNSKPSLWAFNLTELDHARNYILQNTSTVPVSLNTLDIEPYKFLYEQPNGVPNTLSSQEGLAIKTYLSDVYNNWLNEEWMETINTQTAVDTTGNSFTIEQLILSRKVFDMLNRIAVSGGTLDDWQEVVYDHRPYSKSEIPMYMGGLIKEIVFQEVVSNSQSADQPLGTLAGRGTLAKKHKGGKVIIKIDESGMIMGMVSITPRIDYSQGNEWYMHLLTLDDMHKPALDEIGFQDSINEERAWWDTVWDGATWIQRSAGKVPAWLNYHTNKNRVFGNFAIENNEMFMVLNRRYEPFIDAGVMIKDLTTYIDPSKFNFIFAETRLDAQNFWVQIAVDMTVRNKMSGKVMPQL